MLGGGVDAPLAPRPGERDIAQRLSNRVEVERPRLRHRQGPEVDQGIRRLHRVAGDAVVAKLLLEPADESLVVGGGERLEVGRPGQLPADGVGREQSQFVLAQPQPQHRGPTRAVQAAFAQLLVEPAVVVAREGREDGGLGRLLGKRVEHWRPVGPLEGDKELGGELSLPGGEVLRGDVVRGARVKPVAPQEDEPGWVASLRAEQPVECREDLLVGQGPAADQVRAGGVPLGLGGEDEQSALFFEEGEHGPPTGGGVAPEHDRDLVFDQQFAGPLGVKVFGPRPGVGGDGLDLSAQQATASVDLFEGEQFGVAEGRFTLPQGPGLGMQQADLDVSRLLGETQSAAREEQWGHAAGGPAQPVAAVEGRRAVAAIRVGASRAEGGRVEGDRVDKDRVGAGDRLGSGCAHSSTILANRDSNAVGGMLTSPRKGLSMAAMRKIMAPR